MNIHIPQHISPMRYKSYILSVILAAMCALSAWADNEVIINIAPRYRIIPPNISYLITYPGDLFNVSITNPLDESIDVYLAYQLEQLEVVEIGDKTLNPISSVTDVDPSSPQNYQPNAIITLPPSSTKMLSGFELSNSIGFYPIDGSYIKGLDEYKESALKTQLLPEGHYQLTFHAYRTLGQNGTRPLLSNPELSKADFWVNYKIIPSEFFGANLTNRVLNVDEGKNADGTNDMNFRPEYADCPLFNFRTATNELFWNAPRVSAQLAGVFNFNYELEIYRLMKGVTLEDLTKNAGMREGSRVLLEGVPDQKNIPSTFITIPPQTNLTEFNDGDYYAIRLRTINTNQQDQSQMAGFSRLENDGYSEWHVIRATSGFVAATTTDEPGAVVPVVPGMTTIISVPKITTPTPAESGFKRCVLDSNSENVKFEWEAPKVIETKTDDDKKKADKTKYAYRLAVYNKGDSEDLDKITSATPLYLKAGLETTSFELPYRKDLADKVSIGQDYIVVVTAAPKDDSGLKDEEICWTGKGSNCYSFAPFAIKPRSFDGCYADEAPTEFTPKSVEIPKDGDMLVYVGSTKTPFPLHLQKITGSSQQNIEGVLTPVYNGSGYVEWNTGLGGKTVKVAVDFAGLAINKKNQVIAGSVVSSKMTGTGIDWIPYDAINAAIAKTQGLAGDANTMIQNAIDAMNSGIDTAANAVFDAIKAGTTSVEDAAKAIADRLSGISINADGQAATDVAQAILSSVLEMYVGDFAGNLTGSLNINLGELDIPNLDLGNLNEQQIQELKDKYVSTAKSKVQGFFDKLQEEVVVSPEMIKSKCSKYWEYINKGGKQIGDIAVLTGLKDEIIHLPLSVPSDFWTESTPEKNRDGTGVLYDLSIMRMEFGPDRSQVSALMLANLSDAEPDGVDMSNVLAFVAPRLCIRPGELIPETGEFGLLYDFAVKDIDSGLKINFKACEEWGDKDYTAIDEKTSDYTNYNSYGTFVHWGKAADNKKEVLLSVAAGMKMTMLYNLLDENPPELEVGGQVFLSGPNAGNWLLQGKFLSVGDAKPGFRIPDLKDLKFYTGALVIDMSVVSNSKDAITCPEHYNWGKFFGDANDLYYDKGTPLPINWKGVCFQGVSVELLSCLDIYESEQDRDNHGKVKKLLLDIGDVMVDKTGVTMTAAFKSNMLRAGDLSGWYISLDEIGLNIVQNTFDGCYFNGKIGVPIISQKIDYECRMNLYTASDAEAFAQKELYTNMDKDGKVKATETLAEGEKAFYLNFKTKFSDMAHVNLGIAALHLHEKGTWMELKYLEGYETQAEFMASGTITLGGAGSANEQGTGSTLGDIPYEIPGIRFTGLRVANFSLKAKHAGDEKSYGQKFIDSYVKALEEDKVELWGLGFGRLVSNDHDKYGLTYDEYSKLLANKLLADENEGGHEMNFGGNGYFSWGAWSLASEEKSFFDMPLKLDGIEFIMNNTKQIGLSVKGLLSILETEAGCDLSGLLKLNFLADLKIPANVQDLSKYVLEFLKPDFDEIGVDGAFGGGMVKATGRFSLSPNAPDGVTGKGFDATLKLNIKGLCEVDVGGGWYSCVDNNTNKKFKALYMLAKMDSKAGIPVGGPTGVTINHIMGGFYFNYSLPGAGSFDYETLSKAVTRPKIDYGSMGGVFALGLKWGAAEASMVEGKFGMLVSFDQKNGRLGQFRMFGNIEAFKGTLKGGAQILYENNTKGLDGKVPTVYSGEESRYNDCQYFNLTLTVEQNTDLKETAMKMLGTTAENFDKKCKELTEMAKGGLGEFGAAGEDKTGGETKQVGEDKVQGQEESDKKDVKETDGGLSAKCGFEVSFEFEYRHYTGGGKDKWHFYLGKPAFDDRCKLTFFDIKIGKSPAMIRAYAFADGYLCIGNELPDNGKLPDIPSEVANYLEKGSNRKDVVTEGGALSIYQQEREKLLKEGPGGNANIKFGVQFGARIAADFAVEAVFAYAKMGGQLGFDLVLKQFADNCLCSDGSRLGGKAGFYAMGQIYAYMYGELGLIIDLGIWSGEFSLGRVDLGAMLKGGFPNPNWAYGKVRAYAEVLGGLFTVNKTIEIKVGRVCVPMMGDPLMNIEIFSDFGLGYGEKDTGWDPERAVDIESDVTFATSMEMGKELPLVDEDRVNNYINDHGGLSAGADVYAAATEKAIRKYKFIVAETKLNKNDVAQSSNDNINFRLNCGVLEAEKKYEWKCVGRALEERPVYQPEASTDKVIQGKSWRLPLRRDPSTGEEHVHDFVQDTTLYFCTGQATDDIGKYVRMMTPFDETNATLSEVAAPTVSLATSFEDKFYDPQYKWVADLEVWNEKEKAFVYPDYDPHNPYADSRYQSIPLNYLEEKGRDVNGIDYRFYIVEPNAVDVNVIQPNTKYRWTFYKLDETGYKNFMKDAETKFVSLMNTIALSATATNIINENQGLAGTYQATEDNSANMSETEKQEAGSMSKLMNEFAEYTASTDKELIDLAGDEDVRRRLNVLREEMKNGIGQYRTLCLQFEATTGTHRTVKEQMLAFLKGEAGSELSYTRTIKGLDGKDYKLEGVIASEKRTDIGRPMVYPLSMDADANSNLFGYNPYYVINFWGGWAMRPLSEHEQYFEDKSMMGHFFNRNLKRGMRENGATLLIQVVPETERGTDLLLWRNNIETSMFDLGFSENNANSYQLLEAYYSPMMANQWIPMRGRISELGQDLAKVMGNDYTLAYNLQKSIRDEWTKLAGKPTYGDYGPWSYVDTHWNDTSYDFAGHNYVEIYSDLVTNQKTKLGSTKQFSYPLYQLPLIHMLRWNHLPGRYGNSDATKNWPQNVNSNGDLMPQTDTSKAADLAKAIAIMSCQSDRDKSYDFKPKDFYKANVRKMTFWVMRPNAYNTAAIKSSAMVGTDNRYADILAGKPRQVHNVTMRPSTEPDYKFQLTINPTSEKAFSYSGGTGYSVIGATVDNMNETTDVWISSHKLRQYVANYLNKKLGTSYTDNMKFQRSHLAKVTDLVDATVWPDSLVATFDGVELLENLQEIDVKLNRDKKRNNVDLRKCKKLKRVKIAGLTADKVLLSGLPELTYVNITGERPVKEVYSYDKGIGYLDLTDSKALKELYVSGNRLSSVEGLQNLANVQRMHIYQNEIHELDVTNMTNLSPENVKMGGQYKHKPEAGAGKAVEAEWQGIRTALVLKAPRDFEEHVSGAMTFQEFIAFFNNNRTLPDRYYNEWLEYYPDDVNKAGKMLENFGVLKRSGSKLGIQQLADSLLVNAILNQAIKDKRITIDPAAADRAKERGYREGTYPYNAMACEKFLTSEYAGWESKMTHLDASGQGIKTLGFKDFGFTGYFDYNLYDLMPNLEELNLNDNILSKLDVSGFDKLTSLKARNNRITDLTLSDRAGYTDIDLSGNFIALLKLPETSSATLKSLNMASNGLMEMTLPVMPNLKELDCSGNRIQKVYAPVSTLDKLVVSNNPIEKQLEGLFGLGIFVNNPNNLKHIEVSNIDNLEKAYVSPNVEVFKARNCPNLYRLDIMGDKLTKLTHFDVSKCPKLDIAAGIKGKQFPAILTFNASESNLGGGDVVTKSLCRDLGIIAVNKDFQVFDIHDNKLQSMTLLMMLGTNAGTSSAATSTVEHANGRTFAIGNPGRTNGTKLNCGMLTDDILAEWDAVYQWQPNNANVNAFKGESTSGTATEAVDVADDSAMDFKKKYPEVHDRLWKKYAAGHNFFSPDMAASISDFEIDASNLNIDLSSLLNSYEAFYKNVVSINADKSNIRSYDGSLKDLDLTKCVKLKNISLNDAKMASLKLMPEHAYNASIKNATVPLILSNKTTILNYDDFQSLDLSYTAPKTGSSISVMKLDQAVTKKFEYKAASKMRVIVDPDLNETVVKEGKYKTIIEPNVNNGASATINFKTPNSAYSWFMHPEYFSSDTDGLSFVFYDTGVKLPIYSLNKTAEATTTKGAKTLASSLNELTIDPAKMRDHVDIMQHLRTKTAWENLTSDLGTDKVLEVEKAELKHWNAPGYLNTFLSLLPNLKSLTLADGFTDDAVNLDGFGNLTDIAVQGPSVPSVTLPSTFNRAAKAESKKEILSSTLDRAAPSMSHTLGMRSLSAVSDRSSSLEDVPATLALSSKVPNYYTPGYATLTDYAQQWFDSFTYTGTFSQPEITVKARTKPFDFNFDNLETENIYVEQGSTTPLNIRVSGSSSKATVYFETTEDFVNTFNPATYHSDWDYYVCLGSEYPYMGQKYLPLSTHTTPGAPSAAWAKQVVEQTRADLDKMDAERDAEETKRQEFNNMLRDKYGRAVSAWVGNHFSDPLDMAEATAIDMSGETVDPVVFELMPKLTKLTAVGTTFERDGKLQDVTVPTNAWIYLNLRDAKMAALVMPMFAEHAHNGSDYGAVFCDLSNASYTSAMPRRDGSFAAYLVDCYSTKNKDGRLRLNKLAGSGDLRLTDGTNLFVEAVEAPADYSVYLPADKKECTVKMYPAGGKKMSIYFQNADQILSFFSDSDLKYYVEPSDLKSAYRMFIKTPDGFTELDLDYKGGDFNDWMNGTTLYYEAKMLTSPVISEFVKTMQQKLGTTDFSTVKTLNISDMTIHPDINLRNLGFTNVKEVIAARTVFSDGTNLYCPDLASLRAMSIDLRSAKANNFNKIVNDCFNAIDISMSINLSGCDIKELHMPGNMVERRSIVLVNTNSQPCKIYVPQSPVADQAPTITQFHRFKVTPASGNIVDVYFENPYDIRQWVNLNYSSKSPNVHLYIKTRSGYRQIPDVEDPELALIDAQTLIDIE